MIIILVTLNLYLNKYVQWMLYWKWFLSSKYQACALEIVFYGEKLLDILVFKYLAIPRLTKARLKISWKEISVMTFLLSLFFSFLFKGFDTGSHAAILKLDGMV